MSQTTENAATIQVSEEAWIEILPTAALLHLRLKADRFFSGRAALEKAEELRRLIVVLGARGFPDDAVTLEGGALDVSTGLFGRSSSVTYRVRVAVKDVDRLADALDAVASCKSATLDSIEWDYQGPTKAHAAALTDCATRALSKAKTLAAALGVDIARVRSVREERDASAAPQIFPQMLGAPFPASRARSSIASEIGGLELAPPKKVGVRVLLECEIA
jgi:uncharacterized protein YggE